MHIAQDPLNLIICGTGGQGNILVSQMLARALMKKGFIVTRGETYGAAQRGGAVLSTIRISEKKSYGPLIPEGKAHIVLGLEPLETLRTLKKYGNPRVVCITNTHPILPIGAILSCENRYPSDEELRAAISRLSRRAWFVNAASVAAKLGVPMATNIIMVGALLGTRQLPLKAGDVKPEIEESFPPETSDLNLKALQRGIAVAKRKS
jgi:indolepyruvate ferredoxin oxidoreductase beta subunit